MTSGFTPLTNRSVDILIRHCKLSLYYGQHKLNERLISLLCNFYRTPDGLIFYRKSQSKLLPLQGTGVQHTKPY